ncbi:BTB/POZ domain-containing protein At5g47800 [Olea europaea subsp. europaea]|uniref:BTB/POZ domain-containing protein At5g47800 n=1 Tax=Olea europaea subsp. europaea TaxID=158383 RepID=A0A8S0Q8M4_OLEEU|nr:BTB/POZ domain-containing protein At5g47800 [Olea europaea subsp. europaea]
MKKGAINRFQRIGGQRTYLSSPPQLIEEALHVYTCRRLPDITKTEKGSVSIGFMIRLLGLTNFLGASPVTKAELTRRSGMQFEEVTLNDLLLPAQSSNDHNASYDNDLVKTVLESFLRH